MTRIYLPRYPDMKIRPIAVALRFDITGLPKWTEDAMRSLTTSMTEQKFPIAATSKPDLLGKYQHRGMVVRIPIKQEAFPGWQDDFEIQVISTHYRDYEEDPADADEDTVDVSTGEIRTSGDRTDTGD